MKTPHFDHENSTDEFTDAFELQRGDRAGLQEIIKDDVLRAQRMAAAGLRHLNAILGANKQAGIRDRWRKDALVITYFGKTSSVSEMKLVEKHLSRVHRRLRDDQLHIRLRQQQYANLNGSPGRNAGWFLSPKRFQLFPAYAYLEDAERSSVIIHELLHEWLMERYIDGQRAYGELALALARRQDHEARRNPENFQLFCEQVWFDEGLEAPSGAVIEDKPLTLAASVRSEDIGQIQDRPVLCRARLIAEPGLFVLGVHGLGSGGAKLIMFERDGNRMARRFSSQPTSEIEGSPDLCRMGDHIYVTAAREKLSDRLQLVSWKVQDGAVRKLGDSGSLIGSVHETPAVIWLGGNELAVLMKIKNGRMKVISMRASDGGTFTRQADAETSGPIYSAPSGCLIEPYDDALGHPENQAGDISVIATAFCTREGKLSFDCWEIRHATRKVMRRGGLVDRAIEGRPAVVSWPQRAIAVVAANDAETGRLRLTAFNVADPLRPRRLGDTGDAGVLMTHSPAAVAIDGKKLDRVATAIRMADGGRLRIQQWSVDCNGNWIRRADAGKTAGPVIDGSPAICECETHGTFHTLTAAQNDGVLKLQFWEA
ncbi:MAG: hypothetical protein R3C14_51050 [Caldilineaceae bacterium]